MKLPNKYPLASLTRVLTRAYSSTTTTTTTPPLFPLKHVTQSNFWAVLQELRGHVAEADFVAIDLEMTGITSAPWRESFDFDRFDVKYLKVKDSAEKFAVVQFGVCPFRWDPQSLSFLAHPYNFFVFGRQEFLVSDRGGGPSYEFLCQTTSMDFLAKYQFDFSVCIREGDNSPFYLFSVKFGCFGLVVFNFMLSKSVNVSNDKCIKDVLHVIVCGESSIKIMTLLVLGLSYLSRTQEEEARRCLDVQYGNELSDTHDIDKDVEDLKPNSVTDLLFSERMRIRLTEWRDGLLSNGESRSHSDGNSHDSTQKFQTIFYKMRPALSLNGFTRRQHRLIQLVTKKYFKDLACIRVLDESSHLAQLVVYTESKSDHDMLMKEVYEDCRKVGEVKIEAAIGFRHVIDLLCSEQKLIVGHNCFLDIAHIYNKFFGSLPPTAKEFVSSITKHFPYVVDTKILLNANSVLRQRMMKSSTSLSSAFSLLCPHIASSTTQSIDSALHLHVKVEIQVDGIRSSNWNSGIKHEAGYDAFMTGCIFAQACSNLEIDFKFHSAFNKLADNEKLRKHVNILYLSWTSGDIIDLSTGNSITESLEYYSSNKRRYPKILFDNIVLVWGFPSELKAAQIRESLNKAFGYGSVVSVYHVDETAVFVQFSKKELVSVFLALKETLEKRNNDAVSVLHPLANLLEGGKTCAGDYETYKEICSSSVSRPLFADQAEAIGVRCKATSIVMKEEESQGEIFCADILGNSQIAVHSKNVVVDKDLRNDTVTCESVDEGCDSFYGEVKEVRANNL